MAGPPYSLLNAHSAGDSSAHYPPAAVDPIGQTIGCEVRWLNP